jgi:hypothetical protein
MMRNSLLQISCSNVIMTVLLVLYCCCVQYCQPFTLNTKTAVTTTKTSTATKKTMPSRIIPSTYYNRLVLLSTLNPSSFFTDEEWHPNDPAYTTPQLLVGIWDQIAMAKTMTKGVSDMYDF